jgi:hypothetical protein
MQARESMPGVRRGMRHIYDNSACPPLRLRRARMRWLEGPRLTAKVRPRFASWLPRIGMATCHSEQPRLGLAGSTVRTPRNKGNEDPSLWSLGGRAGRLGPRSLTGGRIFARRGAFLRWLLPIKSTEERYQAFW